MLSVALSSILKEDGKFIVNVSLSFLYLFLIFIFFLMFYDIVAFAISLSDVVS